MVTQYPNLARANYWLDTVSDAITRTHGQAWRWELYLKACPDRIGEVEVVIHGERDEDPDMSFRIDGLSTVLILSWLPYTPEYGKTMDALFTLLRTQALAPPVPLPPL